MEKIKTKIYDRFLTRKRKYQKKPLEIKDFILNSQYWERSEMESWQLEKFNQLLKEAINESKFFNKRQDEFIDEFYNIHSIGSEFPKLTKEIILSNAESLHNPNVLNGFKHSTSGSTGKPLSVWVSNIAEAHRKARLERFLEWWGVEIYDKNVLIVGVGDSHNSARDNLKNWMRNRKVVNVLDLNDHTIFDYFELVNTYQPAYIRGYASAVLQFAKLMQKHNLIFTKNFLKVVIVTAEMLIEDDRKFMEEVLQCRVANEYGAAEFGIIANECPQGSMHINEESILISTDEDDNAIITDLFNNKMPLICYMNEDRLVLSENSCECGRTLKVIDKIQGRSNSFIQCPDGSEKNMYLFYKIISGAHKNIKDNCIQQFKVYQSGMNFVYEVIPKEGYDDSVGNYIKIETEKEIGKGISVDIKLVKHIKREKSGKLKFFEILK